MRFWAQRGKEPLKERGKFKWHPTVVAVGLVLVLGVGEGQHWVGAAGQTGTPPWGFTQTPAAPQPHGTLWWHHSLTVGVQVLARSHCEAAVGEAHLGAEGQAATRRGLADTQLTETEMLTWNTNRWWMLNLNMLLYIMLTVWKYMFQLIINCFSFNFANYYKYYMMFYTNFIMR